MSAAPSAALTVPWMIVPSGRLVVDALVVNTACTVRRAPAASVPRLQTTLRPMTHPAGVEPLSEKAWQLPTPDGIGSWTVTVATSMGFLLVTVTS